MTAHKWVDEIKAWADGKAIEQRYLGGGGNDLWHRFTGHWSDDWTNVNAWEYRIKPEPKPDVLLHLELRYSGFFYGLYSTASENASVCAILDGETYKLKSVRMIGKPDPNRMEALLRIVLDEDISLDTRAEIKEALRTD